MPGRGAPHHAPARAPEPVRAPSAEVSAHTAPHDELVDVVRELAGRAPGGAVLIDTLARALKERGFSRPPGSPRLITRRRRIRELAVSRTGMITLVSAAHAAPAPEEALEESEPMTAVPAEAGELDGNVAPEEADEVDGNVAPAAVRAGEGRPGGGPRRGRRRRRRRRRGGGGGGTPAAPA